MDLRTEPARRPDPRIDRCKKHHLADILLSAITALVCGAASVGDIVFFGETRSAWLKQQLILPNGIPCRRHPPAGAGPHRPPEV